MTEPRRDTGWYWVRYSGGPEVAFYDAESGMWVVVGSETSVSDDEMTVLAGPLQPPEMPA